MDLNSQNPYDVIEDSELDYSFCTKDGIKYRAYFLSVSHLHDSFTDAYSFSNAKNCLTDGIIVTIAILS